MIKGGRELDARIGFILVQEFNKTSSVGNSDMYLKVLTIGWVE